MAVTEVWEKPGTATGAWNRLYQRTYSRTFRVVCDDPLDGPVAIRTGGPAFGLPVIGNTYLRSATELDKGAFVSDHDYKMTELLTSGCEWEVTVKYGPYDGSLFGPNPTSWPPRVAFTAQKYEKAISADQAGTPILNSAFCPFEEPVTIDDSRSIMTVVRNEAIGTFDLTLAESYRDKVNDATWNGFAAKTVKCSSITTSQPQYDSNDQVYFFEVTYVFEVNRDKWQKVILDQGYQKLDSSGYPTPITNDGKTIDSPALLNGSGAPLASTGTPVFKTFDVYPSADFSVFNIDLTTVLGKV